MELYIGLDVSLASTAICAVSGQGKIVMEATAASEPEELVAALKAMPGGVVAVGLVMPMHQRATSNELNRPLNNAIRSGSWGRSTSSYLLCAATGPRRLGKL